MIASSAPSSERGRLNRSNALIMFVRGVRYTIALGIGLLLLAASEPSMAANEADWSNCTGSDVDRAIAACGRIIDSLDAARDDRLDAYLYRGGLHLAKGNLDRAIADYDEAIKLNPRNVTAFGSRAIASYRRGERHQSAIDYLVAKKLDSKKVDEMAAANSEFKEIADMAIESVVPEAELKDALNKLTPKLPTCDIGFHLDGETCVPITCPIGQRLSDSSCLIITCASGEVLQGNDCVKPERYAAVALGATTRLFLGASWNHLSSESAQQDALVQCHMRAPRRAASKCKIILNTDSSACMAVFWTPTGTGWGGATRSTRSDALDFARETCRKYNPHQRCVSAGSWCNL
jgi:hypothetical protein